VFLQFGYMGVFSNFICKAKVLYDPAVGRGVLQVYRRAILFHLS